MAVVVFILVIAVAGTAVFVTKAVWFTLMAEVWRRPLQLRPAARSDRLPRGASTQGHASASRPAEGARHE